MQRRLPLFTTDATHGDAGGRFVLLFALSGLTALATLLPDSHALRPFLYGMASLLFLLAAIAGLSLVWRHLQRRLARRGALKEIDLLTRPVILTDWQGRVIGQNRTARGLPELAGAARISDALDAEIADPARVLDQMINQIARAGTAERRLASGRMMSASESYGDTLVWIISPRIQDIEASPLPSLQLSDTGEVLAQNTAAQRMFGPTGSDFSTQLVQEPLSEGTTRRLKTLEGELDGTLILQRLDENTRRLTVVPQTRDVSLDAQPVMVRGDFLDALPVPMLKIAADGQLIQANAEARTILGIGSTELPPLFELVEGMGRPIADWLSDAAEGKGLMKPEIVRAVLPGQELFLQIALGRMLEDDQVVLVGILNDATELKTLEAQFVQSQKMQAIGQLAGGVAHDFNNLLTAISGHCDLMLLRTDSGHPDYSDLIQISQNANRAASLVGQLLAFSRKQNLKPQSLDIRDTMSDLAHLLNRLIGERITLEVSHAPGPQMIRADRRQLEQVIVNLVVNARDAMPEGGQITVRTRPEFLDAEAMRDRARLDPGAYVVIEVEDTGIGIPHEGLTKIFEPFYTTKKTGEGTGLGLSTAYGIVKQTGGYIFVDSVPGEGTTFTLYFRATQKKASDDAPVQPRESRTIPGDGVVLLVEDEAPVRAFAARALRLRGYTVIEAECAEVALEVLEDTALRIDLFVTDVIMPGMDGPTWVRQALKSRPDTPVVFMSGYAEEGHAERQARIPNSVFLPKPFSLQQLTSLVQEQLR